MGDRGPGSWQAGGARGTTETRNPQPDTLPARQEAKGKRGPGCWQADGVVSELSIRQTLNAIRLGQHVVLSLPQPAISDSPVISGGLGRPMSCRMVGAMSARRPVGRVLNFSQPLP